MLNNSNFGQNKTREHIDFLVDKRSFSKEEYEKILELALIGNLSEDVFFEFVNCGDEDIVRAISQNPNRPISFSFRCALILALKRYEDKGKGGKGGKFVLKRDMQRELEEEQEELERKRQIKQKQDELERKRGIEREEQFRRELKEVKRKIEEIKRKI